MWAWPHARENSGRSALHRDHGLVVEQGFGCGVAISAGEHAMKRPRTTGHLAVPLPESVLPTRPLGQEAAVVGTVAALLALIAAVETQPVGPATKAYRAAIRRKGEEAAAAGGSGALEAVRHQICATAPDRAERRERILAEAWAGLVEVSP